MTEEKPNRASIGLYLRDSWSLFIDARGARIYDSRRGITVTLTTKDHDATETIVRRAETVAAAIDRVYRSGP